MISSWYFILQLLSYLYFISLYNRLFIYIYLNIYLNDPNLFLTYLTLLSVYLFIYLFLYTYLFVCLYIIIHLYLFTYVYIRILYVRGAFNF